MCVCVCVCVSCVITQSSPHSLSSGVHTTDRSTLSPQHHHPLMKSKPLLLFLIHYISCKCLSGVC